MTELAKIQTEVTNELADPKVLKTLVTTTFKGLSEPLVKQAVTEGMMRGFNFKDFLQKNVYAVPFGTQGYSLVTSIDYARKIGQRSGVNGKSKPTYTEKSDGRINTCSITVYKVGGHPEGYTSEVYFDEYNTKKNQWVTKPRTMIAKVAEMHALRMACPEELSQSYSEEEMELETKPATVVDTESHKAKLESSKTLDELKTNWALLPAEAKCDKELGKLKDELKAKLTPNENNQVRQ